MIVLIFLLGDLLADDFQSNVALWPLNQRSSFSTIFSQPQFVSGQPLLNHFEWEDRFLLKCSGTEFVGNQDLHERTTLSGPTELAETSDGVISNINFVRKHKDLQNAREFSLPCLKILGGPWKIEDCRIQSQGGTSVICRSNSIQVERCKIGGDGPGRLRAGEGLSLHGNTLATVSMSEFSQCLAAVVAVDSARVSVISSAFSDVSYALCVDGHGCISASSCGAVRVALGLLFAGSDAQAASLDLSHTTADAARLWFGGGRPGSSRFENNTLRLGGGRASALQASSPEREAAARALLAAAQEVPAGLLAGEYPGR